MKMVEKWKKWPLKCYYKTALFVIEKQLALNFFTNNDYNGDMAKLYFQMELRLTIIQHTLTLTLVLGLNIDFYSLYWAAQHHFYNFIMYINFKCTWLDF